MEFQLDQIQSAAKKILEENSGNYVFAFHGELGAGKTTFIKALCEQLGVKDAMSSPTFSIVNEYHDSNGKPVYHMDSYRIKNGEEALNVGLEEYLYSGNYVFIEWPEVVEELLPDAVIHVFISTEGELRKLEIKG